MKVELANRLRRARGLVRHWGWDVGRVNSDASVETFLQLMLFPRMKINCVLDVGANHGSFGQRLRDNGYKGRIISFEPAVRPYRVLTERAHDDPSWIVHLYGLGDREMSIDMEIRRGENLNSLLPMTQEGRESFGHLADVTGHELVQIHRLEDVFASCVEGIPQPRVYLKIDTQGYDTAVLRGAMSVLHYIPALQVEIALKEHYTGAGSLREMHHLLGDLGYDLSGLWAVQREPSLILGEADGVFVRREG